MVFKWLDGRLEAAGVSGDWPGLSRLVMVELILPVCVVPILCFVVAPNCHGADRVLVGATMLAILAQSAVGMVRNIHAAERLHRAQAGVSEAVRAIDSASRATNAVLTTLKGEIVPALDRAFAAAAAMTKDRRLSPSVRGRAAKIQKSGEGALALLRDVVEPPHAEADVFHPHAASAAVGAVVALPPSAPLALTGPRHADAESRAEPRPPHPDFVTAPTAQMDLRMAKVA